MLYRFSKPFKYGDETVETVELREEYTAGDMIRIANAKGDGDKTGAMLCAATGWPLPKVAQIPFMDSVSISEAVASFFGNGKQDGRAT